MMNLTSRNSTYNLSRLGGMILAFLAIVLVVVWIAVVWGLQSLQQEAVKNSYQESNNIARVLQEQVTRAFEIIDKATLRVNEASSGASDYRAALAQIDTERLVHETGLYPDVIAQFGIVGADGRLIQSNLDPTGKLSGQVNLSDREHIRVHLSPDKQTASVHRINTDGLFIGQPVLGKVSQRWTIQVSRGLSNAQGQRIGVVVASVNPSYFEKVFQDVYLGPAGSIALVGDDGIVRAQVVEKKSVGLGEVLTNAQDDPEDVRAGGQSGFIETDGAGQRRVVVSRRIPGHPLRLRVSVRADWALANWQETRNFTLILTCLLSLGVVGAAFFFVRVVRRIDRQNDEMRAHHQLKEMTMDAMQDGVLRLDRQGRLIEANPMALELLGVRKDKVIGVRIDDVLIGEQHHHRMGDWFVFEPMGLVAYLRRHIDVATGVAPPLPIPLLSLDANGQVLWATSTAGELLGLDISALQPDALAPETVAELLRAQAIRQAAAEPPPQPHVVEIPWQVGDQRSMRLATLLLPAEKGQPLVVWIIPDFDGLSAFAIRSLRNVEWRILHPETELIIPVLLTASPLLDSYNRITGAVLTLKDVRDVKAQEEENLRMVKKMEQSQKLDALGQLAAGVAHDFNNLLGVIQSHAELVEMKIGADSPAVKNLNAILQATSRAQNIVLSLNSLGRDAKGPESSGAQGRFELFPLLLETQSLLQASLKGIDITFNVLEQVPPQIMLGGESGALQQVLVNLCVNASHAIGDHRKGRIAIELRSVQEGFVLLDVVDNGSGIPPEILPRIFEPFFTTKGVGQGTGLGLAMVHSIISKMNGSIDCQSELGVGTRFSIKLPCY